jgi:GDPmannose 4,6-dehydratase
LEKVFGYLDLNWEEYVKIDQRYYRPAEVDILLGDCTKAREKLGWTPEVDFDGLVKMMVDSDMKIAERERIIADNIK